MLHRYFPAVDAFALRSVATSPVGARRSPTAGPGTPGDLSGRELALLEEPRILEGHRDGLERDVTEEDRNAVRILGAPVMGLSDVLDGGDGALFAGRHLEESPFGRASWREPRGVVAEAR